MAMTTARDGTIRRRGLLAGGVGATVGVGLTALPRASAAQAASAPAAARPLPAYVGPKDPAALIVHTPTTIETRRAAFGNGVVTPTEQLFIRNNLPAPDASIVADRDAWQLAVEGVRSPRTLTLGELKTIGIETVATVLQCSGNGRGFFPSKPPGTPWQVGAAGCVVWSGVPVRHLVERLGGIDAGARWMTGTGGETLPAGIDPLTVLVERSVGLKAMNDAILAWELNGVPLPLAHGGPLRLVVPGYSGINNVKYVRRLAFTEVESPARIQQIGYRFTPPGQASKPSDPSIQEMNVKSFVTAPAVEGGQRPRHGRRLRRRAADPQGRGLDRRRQDLARRRLRRPGPRPLRVAAVRDPDAHGRRHL